MDPFTGVDDGVIGAALRQRAIGQRIDQTPLEINRSPATLMRRTIKHGLARATAAKAVATALLHSQVVVVEGRAPGGALYASLRSTLCRTAGW